MTPKPQQSDEELSLFGVWPKVLLTLGVIAFALMVLMALFYYLIPKYYPEFIYKHFQHPYFVARAYMIHGDSRGARLLGDGNKKQVLAALYPFVDSRDRVRRIRTAKVLSSIRLPEKDLEYLRKLYVPLFVNSDIEERLGYAALMVDLRVDISAIKNQALELMSYEYGGVEALSIMLLSQELKMDAESVQSLRKGMLSNASKRTGIVPFSHLVRCKPSKDWIELIESIGPNVYGMSNDAVKWYVECYRAYGFIMDPAIFAENKEWHFLMHVMQGEDELAERLRKHLIRVSKGVDQ